MAFSKAEALHHAEKLVIQGRISQAIKQYFDIFEKDPSDVVLLNTIGDLYIRDRNVPEGLRHFYRLAEAYVRDGFTLKAIAIYKKIVKLDPDSVDPLLKLVELYQAQRLGREARELYYQVAECYKRKKQNDKVLETLRKVVQLDVESRTASARLAAFCEEIGRKDEATQVYLESAQLALRRGDTAAAQIALKKAQELGPDNPQVKLLRAREALALKHPEEVEAILSATPGLKDDPNARSLLIDSYLAIHQPEKAATLVLDFFRAHPADFSPLASFVSVCLQAGRLDTASKALSAVADELIEQGNTSSLMESLRLIWSKSPQHLPTLELIFRICDETGDEHTLPEILEALGRAYAQCGQFEKAEAAFQRLVGREPANERYKALLRQVLQKQREEFGKAHVADLPASAPTLSGEEGVAAPPASALRAADRDAIVKEALENSELLAHYHLVSKAVAELDRVLEIYPDETEIHKRLVGMCWREMPERAEQAAQALVRIHTQQGDAEGAKRFAQMAGGPTAPAAGAVPLQAVRAPTTSPEPLATLPAQPAGLAAGEISLASQVSPAPVQVAKTAPTPLAQLPIDLATLASSAPPPAPSSEIQEIDLSADWESFQAQTAIASLAPETLREAASFNYNESRIEVNFYLEHGFLEEARKAVEELERMLPGDPRIAELRALVQAHRGAQAAEVPQRQPAEILEFTHLEAVAPPDVEAVERWKQASSYAASNRSTAPTPAPASPLSGLLEEIGEAPGTETVQEDDPETHYNLGVAFREMNLLDEAIGEFQKVVKGAEKRPHLPNYLQACTLLATCFMDKGMAPLAVKWYGRALETPDLDEQAWLALQYDLGVAYEQAGDLPHALEKFTEVYGQNIDFRDVAEKIRTFQQKGS
jgi:tetratricopeptide (TPR) repeat protein